MVRINVYDGQEKIQEVELGNEVVTLGREAGNTVVLPDASVSRRHAQLEPNGNFFLIRDNGSTNGTYVNELLVRVQVLSPGDIVRVGKYLLRVDGGRSKGRDTTSVRVERLRLPARGVPAGSGGEESAIGFTTEPSFDDASRERLLKLYEIQGEIGYIDVPQALLDRSLEIMLFELAAARGSILLCEKPQGGARSRQRFVPAAVRSLEARSGGEAAKDLVIPEELLIQATTRFHALASSVGGDRNGEARSSLVCALRDRSAARGVVYLDRAPGGPPFSQDDLQFLTAIAGQVAISLANAFLFAQISAEKEKIQAIFTSLTDGILVTDRDFRVVEANAAATVLLHLEKRNPLGAPFFDLVSEFQLSPDRDVLRSAGLREGAVFRLGRKGRGEGAQREVLMAGTALPFPRGAAEPEGVVITLRSHSELERMEDLKSQFIGNVAHKLRSPLTVIQGNLPLLHGQVGAEPSLKEVLEEVQRNSSALCHLVDEFTEFAEMEARSIQELSPPEPVKLKPLLRDVIRALEPDARRKGMLIVERLGDAVPPVLVRTERISRAFRRILDNAVKFSGEGGQVIVEAEEAGGYVRIDFVDDGPGIPPAEIESVFYVCHQVDADRTGQVPGAGLGLTIARHIIQEHGGEIRLTSPYRSPDRGTRVSVFLPARPGLLEEAGRRAGGESAGKPVAGGGASAAEGSG
jgi:two-component system phosphate regulon sensor histidine kinase PhoR